MPHLRIETNVPQDKIPADLPAKLCHLVSKILGKAEEGCVTTIIGGANISWGGSRDPAALTTLLSIGHLGDEENKTYSKAISQCISQSIGVPADRMYIHFIDTSASAIGYKGTTIKEIWSQ